MNLTQLVAIVYVILLLGFTLGFLINWFRNRAAIAPYQRLGFWAGIIYVIFELLLLGLSQNMFLNITSICLLVPTLGWGILRMWGFVNNGIFFSNQLNIRSFPLVAPRLGVPPVPAEPPAVELEATVVVNGSAPLPDTAIAAEAVPPEPIEPAAMPVTPIAPPAPASIHWRRYWLAIIGVSVIAVAYSAVLFLITHPRPGLIAQDVVSADVQVMTPLTLVVVVEFAFVEELIFRLGIQNYLGAKLINRRYGYAIAIGLTAAVWSIAHVGSLNPDWVKLAQVFPLGLALGWLYRRQGTESTIMAHGLFNVLGALVLSPLYLR